MVSNLERITSEIKEAAQQIQTNGKFEPKDLVNLIMNIVEIEDENRMKAVAGIHQKVKGMIENATKTDSSKENT